MPTIRTFRLSVPIVVAALAVALAIVVSISAAQSRHAGSGMERGVLLPTHKIFSLAGKVVRLDTRTGAISMMRGSGGTTGSGDEWTQRVSPVSGSTSGMLDVQRVEGAHGGLFLVDVLGDRTWILKGRGIEAGEWTEMRSMR